VIRCLFSILLFNVGIAAEPAPPVNLGNTEHRSLRSEQIGQTYDLLVSLPDGYATSGKA